VPGFVERRFERLMMMRLFIYALLFLFVIRVASSSAGLDAGEIRLERAF
jgi:hypothetical protein